jgi:hypothetical protein
MRDQEIVSYLNSIDFSLVNDDVIQNIYKEIIPFSSELVCDPLVSSSLENLIDLSNSQNLLIFINSLRKNLIYRKLGSRIFEAIFNRLFNLMFIEKEKFKFSDFLDFIVADDCITCSNATHSLRSALMLLSGKKIENLKVIRYDIKDEINVEYSKNKLNTYKDLFLKKLDHFKNNDSFNTLGIFLQITKSQSLINEVIKMDMNVDNIKNRGYFYEILCNISSKKNLLEIYNKIQENIMDLCLEDRSSYFMQSFLRNSQFGSSILKKINLEQFDCNSNIILCLLESLQKSENYEELDNLLNNFYQIENNIFEKFLLEKYGQIDSKYVNLIVNFMGMPKKHSKRVNKDFVKLFDKEWLKTTAGIKLLFGFMEGSEETKIKERFIEKNINLFWSAYKWKDGKIFLKSLLKYASGHTKKKIYEILSKCEQ